MNDKQIISNWAKNICESIEETTQVNEGKSIFHDYYTGKTDDIGTPCADALNKSGKNDPHKYYKIRGTSLMFFAEQVDALLHFRDEGREAEFKWADALSRLVEELEANDRMIKEVPETDDDRKADKEYHDMEKFVAAYGAD